MFGGRGEAFLLQFERKSFENFQSCSQQLCTQHMVLPELLTIPNVGLCQMKAKQKLPLQKYLGSPVLEVSAHVGCDSEHTHTLGRQISI